MSYDFSTSTAKTKKQKKAAFILETLQKLFPNPPIPLSHKDSFTLLIAVLLSAQCTDKRVNTITPILFALADTPEKMSKLSYQQVESIIKPCGLGERKSKAIVDLSNMLIENFHSEVPNTLEDLEKLPGVGHKTASVVLCSAFKKPAFPVDTHIHRLAKRWGLSSGKNVVTTERDLKKIFPENVWQKLHLQLIYYAREYCPAKAHKKEQCPICNKIA